MQLPAVPIHKCEWHPLENSASRQRMSFSSQLCFPKKIQGRQLLRQANFKEGTELQSHVGSVSSCGREVGTAL